MAEVRVCGASLFTSWCCPVQPKRHALEIGLSPADTQPMKDPASLGMCWLIQGAGGWGLGQHLPESARP
jgi:hypothetical protein